MARNPVDRLCDLAEKCKGEIDAFLDEIGADNFTNARRRMIALTEELSAVRQQRDELVAALGADNWRNGVVRARSLLRQSETTSA